MWSVVALAFLAGLVYWTLLEYVLHRFAFHHLPDTFGKRHIAHHENLQKRRLAVAPWQTSVGGALLHAALFHALLPAALAWAGLTGLLVGYVAYELVHYASHYWPSRHPVLKALRRHHMLHHHRSPEARFGVSTAFWDRVFGTLPSEEAATR